MLLEVKPRGCDGVVLVAAPLVTCDGSPSVTDGFLCKCDIVTFGSRENFLPELSKLHSVSLNSGAVTSCAHLSWSRLVVILNVSTVFLREIDTGVWLVRLRVGHLHDGDAVAEGDTQSTMTVKAFHTASNPCLLLAYKRFLGHVVRSASGLTTLIGEPRS